jgi:transposase-like protein
MTIHIKNRKTIKKILVRDHGVKEECAICKIEPMWHGKTLVLQLDHIDGINSNNNVSNLRLLCPNCHSQTSNYTGKNTKGRSRGHRIPSKEELLTLLETCSVYALARLRGVSTRTIYNWLKSYEVSVDDMKIGKFKFTMREMERIRKLYKSGDYTLADIAKLFSASKSTINKIVKNVTPTLMQNHARNYSNQK